MSLARRRTTTIARGTVVPMRPLTRAEAIAFDRHAMHTLGVPGVVLMENAAIGCVQELRRLAGGAWPRVRVEIICGGGNNGGDGYAIARHCVIAGAIPRIHRIGPPRAGSDAEVHARIASALGITTLPIGAGSIQLDGDLIVDALLGTGLDRPVSAECASVIEAMNRAGVPILSVDLPSGLDADTGVPLGVAVRATVTATMVAPKSGFAMAGAERWTGTVVVVPIGVPSPG